MKTSSINSKSNSHQQLLLFRKRDSVEKKHKSLIADAAKEPEATERSQQI